MSKKRQRHNLKLPLDLKDRFIEPYDDFLDILLTNLELLHSTSQQSIVISDDLKSQAFAKAPKGSQWTVWISSRLKDRFHDLKQRFTPRATHGEFVALLLLLSSPQSSSSITSHNLTTKTLEMNSFQHQRKHHTTTAAMNPENAVPSYSIACPQYEALPPYNITSDNLLSDDIKSFDQSSTSSSDDHQARQARHHISAMPILSAPNIITTSHAQPLDTQQSNAPVVTDVYSLRPETYDVLSSKGKSDPLPPYMGSSSDFFDNSFWEDQPKRFGSNRAPEEMCDFDTFFNFESTPESSPIFTADTLSSSMDFESQSETLGDEMPPPYNPGEIDRQDSPDSHSRQIKPVRRKGKSAADWNLPPPYKVGLNLNDTTSQQLYFSTEPATSYMDDWENGIAGPSFLTTTLATSAATLFLPVQSPESDVDMEPG